MNQEQMMSVVRDVLQILGTFLTTYGLLSGEQWQPIAGGVIMIAPVVWGIVKHTKTNAIATVAAMPEVKKVVAVSSIANGSLAADPKVVTQ